MGKWCKKTFIVVNTLWRQPMHLLVTDQGKTLLYVIVDISSPPMGTLSLKIRELRQIN